MMLNHCLDIGWLQVSLHPGYILCVLVAMEKDSGVSAWAQHLLYCTCCMILTLDTQIDVDDRANLL